MWLWLVGLLCTLLLACVIYTLLTTSGSELTCNSFEAFILTPGLFFNIFFQKESLINWTFIQTQAPTIYNIILYSWCLGTREKKFSHPPKEDGDLCERNSSGVRFRVHTWYFYETTAWNHFILYMHISLGGLFNICENGGGSMHPLKNYGFSVIPLNTFNYITIWQTVL